MIYWPAGPSWTAEEIIEHVEACTPIALCSAAVADQPDPKLNAPNHHAVVSDGFVRLEHGCYTLTSDQR